MATAKLVILRHGETVYNAERKLTGLHDVDLTEKGQKQADLAGEKIRDIPFDKAYSSHLKRAFNTAARALKSSGTQEHLRDNKGDWNIDKRPALAEIDWGIYSGMSKDDPFVKAFSWNYDAVPENGESQEQACERIRQFYISEIKPRLQRGENVLVVAHSGVSHAFDVVLGLRPTPAPGTPMMKNAVENAAPSIFEFEDGKLTRVISHAAGLIKPPAANKNKKHDPK